MSVFACPQRGHGLTDRHTLHRCRSSARDKERKGREGVVKRITDVT